MSTVYGERWKRGESLGEGGQSRVFRVRDLQTAGHECALKHLKDDRRVARLESEMAALARISHPNVVQLVDYHVSGKPPYYLVMELLEGGTLRDHVEECKGDIIRSLDLFCAICDGVRAAHEQVPPIIHRDIKPGNILFRQLDGEPVVTDFGLCWIDKGQRFTASHERVGTFGYMAPELEDGRLEQPTAQCDVYSLGKLLYYVVSGGTDFNREKHREPHYDLRKTFEGWGLSTVRNIQMEYVSELLDHMIVHDPTQRFGSVADVRAAAEIVRRLVTEEHYPFADHMPCKFCGQGTYRPHGRRPTSLDTHDRSGVLVAMFECSNCGHLQLFSWHAFERDTKRTQVA